MSERKTITAKALNDEQFELRITVPDRNPDDPETVEVLEGGPPEGKSTYSFILTRDEMDSLCRNSLGALSPKVQIPKHP